MGDLYLSTEEAENLTSIDESRFNILVDQVLETGDIRLIATFRTQECGPYVSAVSQVYRHAVETMNASKSGKGWNEAHESAAKEARRLKNSILLAKRALTDSLSEQTLFRINQNIPFPLKFECELRVTVHYTWRPSTERAWRSGCITFHHNFKEVFNSSFENRNRSRKRMLLAEVQGQRQNEWERMRVGALYSLREYFIDGRSGDEIPLNFNVVRNSKSGAMDNMSMRFWLHQD